MTFEVKENGQVKARIVCGSKQAFEEIRKQYFPNIPANLWRNTSWLAAKKSK